MGFTNHRGSELEKLVQQADNNNIVITNQNSDDMLRKLLHDHELYCGEIHIEE